MAHPETGQLERRSPTRKEEYLEPTTHFVRQPCCDLLTSGPLYKLRNNRKRGAAETKVVGKVAGDEHRLGAHATQLTRGRKR